MTKEDFTVLYDKYLAGDCTPEELTLLEKYRDDFILSEKPWTPAMGDKDEVRSAIYNKLQLAVKPPVRLLNFKWLAAAALLICVITAGLFLHYKNSSASLADTQLGQHKKNLIVPGSDKAILTLADGRVLNLDKQEKGIMLKQGSATITQLTAGQLTYSVKNQKQAILSTAYNSIMTPKGGEYRVVLSDGTKVWLNSATSLKYPAVFSGHERRVELSGEAYFEVAKNKHMPFRVSVKGMAIEVLGTHFNVMAYNNEKAVETTLLEGKVKLTNNHNKKQAYLLPGQCGVMKDDQGGFDVQPANAGNAVAWKNGYFTFNQESIQSIMRKVARWYDVDVEYQGDVSNKTFGGTVSRFADISDLLKTLELTGTIHFKVEGRRVIVMD
jgi:transmembrane sensor